MASSFYRPGETLYGLLLTGALTNTSYDLVLGPGRWAVTLFIDANGISAGIMTANVLMPTGTSGEADTPEALGMTKGDVVAQSLTLTDFIGSTSIVPMGAGSSVPLSGISGLMLYGGLRFTVSAIAGASATNRIWYVAQRV